MQNWDKMLMELTKKMSKRVEWENKMIKGRKKIIKGKVEIKFSNKNKNKIIAMWVGQNHVDWKKIEGYTPRHLGQLCFENFWLLMDLCFWLII